LPLFTRLFAAPLLDVGRNLQSDKRTVVG